MKRGLATILLVLAAFGCGPIGGQSGTRPLPPYAGRAAELFDDTIEPAAVGLDFDKGYSPKQDPMLRERSQTSDAVVLGEISSK